MSLVPFFVVFFLAGHCSCSSPLTSCSDFGESKVICHEKCDAKKKECWQQTELVKCSCQGYVNRLTESATFSLDGKKKSADGFGFISKCDQCHEKCEGDKRRTYEKGHDKGEQCDGGKTADDVIESEKIKMDKVVVEPPKVENAKCLDRGNLTRLCVERCPADGKTCITEVTVDACTCAGKKVHLKESTKYDMKTKEVVFGSTPYKNLGYSRVCGDCFEYCESWPGEEKDYYVNDYITTCFNARKNN